MQHFITLFLLIFFFSLGLVAKPFTHDFYSIKYQPLSEYPYTFEKDTHKDIPFQLSINAYEEKLQNNINPRYEKLINELAYLQVFAVSTIAVIAALPEGVSNWSKEDKQFADIQSLLTKHSDNINKGPSLDNDSWGINYVGHSVAGSYFYIWGRQSGLSWQESAMLTTLMSTFFWEYGWEAFAETPSTQDLIITPLLGSILGEGTNYLYNKILENNGQVYDSIIIGSIGRVLLNPIGEMNSYLDQAFDAADIEISVDYAYEGQAKSYALQQSIQDYDQIQSYFKFNFKFKY